MNQDFVDDPWTICGRTFVPNWTWFFYENTCFYIIELVKYQSFYQVKFSLEFQFQWNFWWISKPGRFKYDIVRWFVDDPNDLFELKTLERTKRGFLVTIKDVKARLQIQRKIVQRNIGFRNLKSGSTYEISVRALKESIQTT